MTTEKVTTYTKVPAPDREAVDRLASDQQRTTSQQVAFIVEQWLAEHGHHGRLMRGAPGAE